MLIGKVVAQEQSTGFQETRNFKHALQFIAACLVYVLENTDAKDVVITLTVEWKGLWFTLFAGNKFISFTTNEKGWAAIERVTSYFDILLE